MAYIPGAICAEALVAVRFPFDTNVQAFMTELGLTHAGATRAAFATRHGLPELDWAKSA
jgi:hypothetical protein